MITGGLAGFLIGLVFGAAQERSWPSIIWQASVGALGAGLLLRWWGGIWIGSLAETHRRRLEMDADAAHADAPRLSSKP